MSDPGKHEGPAAMGDSDRAGFEKVQANDTEITLSNADFLHGVFGSLLAPDRDPRLYAWVCGFADDPLTAPKNVWFGRQWDGGTFIDPAVCQVNGFFSIGLLKPVAEKGATWATVRRKKANFAALPCVMLDDVGTKADALTVPPTWLIETSPGNHQAGYAFDAPIESASDADIYIKALMLAGSLTDGGGQNITRYARLPVGFNTKAKYGQPFRHRLLTWEPDRRYNPLELAEALGLDLTIHESIRSRKARSAHRGEDPEVSDDEGIFQDKADENPVITALKSRGLHKSHLGSGKHDITCPWVAEHTDGIDSGTVYFEPDGAFPRGGFKCQHGHCADRKLRDLIEYLGVTPSAAKNRPTIRVVGGALHTIVGHAETLLAGTGYYFQQGGLIVQVVTDPRGETRVVPLTRPSVQLALTRVAAWTKYDKRSDDWHEIDAPGIHSTALWDAAEYRSLPPLLTLTRQPFMRPNGSVCAASGYDPETGLYGVFNPAQFQIPAAPTRGDAAAAMTRLVELLIEFEFKSQADKAAALSALLTAAVRSTLPVAPGFLATAHTFGSGKSYLLDLIAAFASPDEPAAATFVTDDDEMKKQLLATLMESPPVVKFDEMRGDLVPVKCLLSALTAERIEGRILGVSKMARPSTRTLMLFAGNNVGVHRDMTRRIVPITIDPQTEAPASRHFKSNPLGQLRSHRGAYLADALTVIRAWIQAGCPQSGARPVNGYERWADWCREPLLWLGLPDPCQNIFEQLNADPEREHLGRVMEAWNKTFGHHPVMARELIKRAADVADLHDALNEVAGFKGDIDHKHLGKWLKANAGKIVGGRRIVRDDTFKRNAAYWKLTLLPQSPPGTDYTDLTDSSARAAA